MADNEFLADYEDEPEVAVPSSTTAGATAPSNGKGGEITEGGQKKDYAGIHSSGFRSVLRPLFNITSLTLLGGFFSRRHFQRFPVEARAAASHLRPWLRASLRGYVYYVHSL